MPTYQYECENCHHAFEEYQSMTDAKLKTCPACKKDQLARLIGTGGGIIFKGTGFYETDFKGNGKKQPTSGSTPQADNNPKKGAEKAEETVKTETKSGTDSKDE